MSPITKEKKRFEVHLYELWTEDYRLVGRGLSMIIRSNSNNFLPTGKFAANQKN